MLKLEKSSQLSGITVRLRERERFFGPRVLKALALALLFHLGSLLLFHVTPFSFTSSFIHPPVKVQSSHLARSISAVASIKSEVEEEQMPFPSLIPPLEIAYKPQESSLPPSLALNPHIFQPLEERIWPLWDAPLQLKLEEPRIRLSISGDLAEHSLVATDPLLSQLQPLSKITTPAYVSYRVQMDELTGEIFWHERLQSSGTPAVDQLTEKIIHQLRFAPDLTFDSVTGYLNFTVMAASSGRQ